MKKLIAIYLILPMVLFAQHSPDFIPSGIQCKTCHECDVPTKNNPCLKKCIRHQMITVKHSAEEAPEVITIDKFKKQEDHYQPVLFTHRAHAEMSYLAGGCQTCHHYNPPGIILSCVECHETKRMREDISKPDLKAAYHRQCFDCHETWSHEKNCNLCHAPNGHKAVNKAPVKEVSHPKIETPSRLVFNTGYKTAPKVSFFHNEHTDIFGLECQSCHSNESCTKCHDLQKDKKPLTTKKDAHAKCQKCHETKKDCNFCHDKTERNGFDHAQRTGWKLNEHHSKLKCVSCHESVGKFTRLSKKCNSCHTGWNSETFNHKITGLELDEIHIENECTDCHIQEDYSKPKCSDCHDEDIKYPDSIPGKLLKK